MAVTRPAVAYFGGKFMLGAWIISHFPEHVCYVEPFGGGGSVLLQKTPSALEIYNDIDEEVVNFFRVLRERGDELIRVIELTPFSRKELSMAYEEAEEDLERARRFYVRHWQSWHRGGLQSGWRFQVNDDSYSKIIHNWNRTEPLWEIVRRLKSVQIEQDDAIKVIERFDRAGTLFYVDPPYMAERKSGRWYRHEIDEGYHRRLGDVLNRIKGMAIVSGFESELYEELYVGWMREERTLLTNRNTLVKECLWISEKAAKGQRQLRMEIYRE